MIIGFHLAWTCYGHWFPNDPRGSWSDEVWKPELLELRRLDDGRKVTHPRPVEPGEMRRVLDTARARLKRDVVCLKDSEIRMVGGAFAEVVEAVLLEVHACAIMPNHVHVVVGRHAESYERMVSRLKARASQKIREVRGIRATDVRRERVPIWTEGYWVRYIDNVEQMDRVIDYVNRNPGPDRPQRWSFVRGFNA